VTDSEWSGSNLSPDNVVARIMALLVLLVLTLVNAVFALSEMAVVSARKTHRSPENPPDSRIGGKACVH